MTQNVLADRHHAGLFHSLQLMAKRFGWTLYTPHGREWWDAGYWRFGQGYGDDRLARQFLLCEQAPDPEFPYWPIRYVTLGDAREMDWAYVIATVQDNQTGFHRFAAESGAQYVLQVGNVYQYVEWGLDPLAIVSSAQIPIDGRGVRYHQEMEPIAFVPPVTHRLAASFVNCMSSMGRCADLLDEADRLGYTVPTYGIDGRLGVIKPFSALVDLMRSYGWGWHDKAQGDGFGHVIHSWAAVGRPLIGHASHYRGEMAEPFWRDMETCIDLDRHSIPEVVEIVRSTTPQRHAEMCRAIRAEFERIDYAAEAEQIADLLDVAVAA